MVHDSLSKLRLDRRVLHRRGWIAREELAKELAALPDASAKIAPPEEDESEPSADDTAPE